jgi:hypothetical protein
VGECGIEGFAQWSNISFGLRQQESALEGGHQGGGELVGVRIGPQLSAIAHGSEAVAELCPPPGEAFRDGVLDVEVGLEHLSSQ